MKRLLALGLSALVCLSLAAPAAVAQTADPTATPDPLAPTATPSPTPTSVLEPTMTAVPTLTPGPSPTPTPPPGCVDDGPEAEEPDGITIEEALQAAWTHDGTGNGPRNIVRLKNKVSGQLRVRGNVQVNRIDSDTVAPFNYAFAYNACSSGVATLTVALQLNVYRAGAPVVAPENYAIGVNYGCNRCVALARAVQFVIPVEDPSAMPDDVREAARQLDAELRVLHSEQNFITASQANARISGVVARFTTLASSVYEAQEENVTP